jgi:nucleoside-diphosphate-sugar epimerase
MSIFKISTFQRFTPNQARIFYDFSLSFFSTVLLLGLTQSAAFNWPMLLACPLIFTVITFLTGIYSSRKVSTLKFKFFSLLLSSLISAILISLLSSFQFGSYWFLLSFPYFVLPRIILSSTNKNSSFNYILNRRGPVVVIGGAGYIGSHLVDLLLHSGRSVRVLDQLMYGSTSLDKYLNNSNFELMKGDATDITCLTEVMRGASAVIHLSGLVGDPACAVDREFTRHQNIIATQMVKDIAQSMGVHRFIFSSSCSVYGVSDIEVTETDSLNPVSLYAETKMDSEAELLKSNIDDFIVTILRFATVFGDSPRPRFDLVANLFAAQAMKEGEITIMGPDQWRPFIHVRDLAKAIILVLDAPESKVHNQIFNVGDSRLNMTLLDLGNKVKEVSKKFGVNLKINIIDGENVDKRNYAVSFSKIAHVLNFKASALMEEGVEEIMIKIQGGEYGNYKEMHYSNLITTKNYVPEFYNEDTRRRLYAPISENQPKGKVQN